MFPIEMIATFFCGGASSGRYFWRLGKQRRMCNHTGYYDYDYADYYNHGDGDGDDYYHDEHKHNIKYFSYNDSRDCILHWCGSMAK